MFRSHALTAGISVVAAALALVGCKAVEDAIDKEPQTSYCEAVCDWAVTCHEQDRELDAASVEARCLDATRAADSDCAVAEGEGLDPLKSEAVDKCTSAIEGKVDAGECGAFTGTIDERKAGTPPADCAGLGTDAQTTFDEARDSTQETNDELCDRYAATYCAQLTTCLLGDFEVPQYAIDTIGEPQELCEQKLASVFTDDCKANELYAPVEDLVDANAVREAARACVPGIADMACEDLFSYDAYPPECAGTFVSQDQAIGFATGLLDVACLFDEFTDVAIPGCP